MIKLSKRHNFYLQDIKLSYQFEQRGAFDMYKCTWICQNGAGKVKHTKVTSVSVYRHKTDENFDLMAHELHECMLGATGTHVVKTWTWWKHITIQELVSFYRKSETCLFTTKLYKTKRAPGVNCRKVCHGNVWLNVTSVKPTGKDFYNQ